MNGMQISGDLELDDYCIFHEHVDSVANVDTDGLVEDWQRNLQPNRQPSGTQFMREASKVSALEQAGPSAEWTFIAASTISALIALMSFMRRRWPLHFECSYLY